jgi:hypothetical protein
VEYSNSAADKLNPLLTKPPASLKTLAVALLGIALATAAIPNALATRGVVMSAEGAVVD